jgi:hypothetical protein
MTENQGVCNWAVDLTGGDDPPVLVEVDSSPEIVWQPHSPHFSDWLSVVLTARRPESGFHLFAQDLSSLRTEDLDWLRIHFESGPITYTWPCPINYRFMHQDKQIEIWACEDAPDWQLYAGSEQSLRDLARMVWGFGNLAKTLYWTDDVGQRVLNELRQALPAN